MSSSSCESYLRKLLLQLSSLYFLTLTIQPVHTIDLALSDQLTILHTNDFHSKFQELNKFAALCRQKDKDREFCFGGIARIAAKVKEIRNQDAYVLLLDAGDNFQGSLLFQEFEGYASSYFMNELQYNAMSLGNHEFDSGVIGLEPFLENVTFPVVCANIDTRGISEMKTVVKRTTLRVGGHLVGIVGYITVDTASISFPAPVKFLDEVESVKREVKELRREGVTRIIALGHAGIDIDKRIAREVIGVDIVVGGHTNTFLYTGVPPSTEIPEGNYPEVIIQETGKKVLVVQSYAYGKYLGHLKVTFDSAGRIKYYRGNPILLDSNVKEDPDMLLKLKPFLKVVNEHSTKVVGRTSVLLTGFNRCRTNECNLGNLIADAMVYWFIQFPLNESWTSNAIAIVNGGAVRSSIDRGNITLGHLNEVLPFLNTFNVIEASGKLLMDILEFSVEDYNPEKRSGKFLQMSGIKVIYDLSKPNGHRVASLTVKCADCLIPEYFPVVLKKIYKVSLSDYLIYGGDGYYMIKKGMKSQVITGVDQTRMITYYMMHNSPVIIGIEDRIIFINDTAKEATISGTNTLRSVDIHIWLIMMMLIISITRTTIFDALD